MTDSKNRFLTFRSLPMHVALGLLDSKAPKEDATKPIEIDAMLDVTLRVRLEPKSTASNACAYDTLRGSTSEEAGSGLFDD